MSRNYYEERFKPTNYSSSYIPIENFFLIPKIEVNGNINGCYLMLNRMSAVFGVLKITDNE